MSKKDISFVLQVAKKITKGPRTFVGQMINSTGDMQLVADRIIWNSVSRFGFIANA